MMMETGNSAKVKVACMKSLRAQIEVDIEAQQGTSGLGVGRESDGIIRGRNVGRELNTLRKRLRTLLDGALRSGGVLFESITKVKWLVHDLDGGKRDRDVAR